MRTSVSGNKVLSTSPPTPLPPPPKKQNKTKQKQKKERKKERKQIVENRRKKAFKVWTGSGDDKKGMLSTAQNEIPYH